MQFKIELTAGKFYQFRTVTMIYTGELVAETSEFYALKKAAWVAETLRWAESCATGVYKEVEPYPHEKTVLVFKSGMLDIVEIPELPLEQKP